MVPMLEPKEPDMSDNVFFGGVPTDPEVRQLREAYPESEMEPGHVIPYDDVAKVINTGKATNRFRSVTTRWRNIVERETGRIVIGTEAGVGFKVLDNSQKIDLGHSKLASAVKSSRRAYLLTARVETRGLSQEERDRLLVLQRRSASLIATAQIKSTAELPTLEE